jgi:hypothetical protein
MRKIAGMPGAGDTAGAQTLSNLIGDRGEKRFELAITDYRMFQRPLFRPSHLGDRWPTVDYYVELLGVRGFTPFFFVQVKSTTAPLSTEAAAIPIKVSKDKCDRLYRIPGPTYLGGVHEPSGRAFIRSLHQKPRSGYLVNNPGRQAAQDAPRRRVSARAVMISARGASSPACVIRSQR